MKIYLTLFTNSAHLALAKCKVVHWVGFDHLEMSEWLVCCRSGWCALRMSVCLFILDFFRLCVSSLNSLACFVLSSRS